jgi:hypothetical protein
MQDGFHDTKTKPASVCSNRVFTERERKLFREYCRDLASERGVDPNSILPVTDCFSTTLQLKIVSIVTRKVIDECEARGCTPDDLVGSVIPHERMLQLWAEAEAEAKKPFN